MSNQTETKRKYEQMYEEKGAKEWMDLEDGLYSYEVKTDNVSIKKEEELTVHVLNDGQLCECNMCGSKTENTLCLHQMVNHQFKISESWDTTEEEIILCEECVRKLAALFDVIKPSLENLS